MKNLRFLIVVAIASVIAFAYTSTFAHVGHTTFAKLAKLCLVFESASIAAIITSVVMMTRNDEHHETYMNIAVGSMIVGAFGLSLLSLNAIFGTTMLTFVIPVQVILLALGVMLIVANVNMTEDGSLHALPCAVAFVVGSVSVWALASGLPMMGGVATLCGGLVTAFVMSYIHERPAIVRPSHEPEVTA